MVKASMPHGCQKVMFNGKTGEKAPISGNNDREKMLLSLSAGIIISLSKLFSQICCGLSDLEFHLFKNMSVEYAPDCKG
jgi:hypothetical protein